MLLNGAFAEMTEALARIDENAALDTLAAINGRIDRTLREESARLVAKGYPPDELKDVVDRINETISAAGQAISARRAASMNPARAIDPQHESSEFASLVREAQGAYRMSA
jgi:hypothetical protein